MTENEGEDALLEAIARKEDELVSLLQELIRSKPVNPPGDEERAARILRPRLEKLDFDVTEYTEMETRPNLVARRSFGDGPTLLMNAHLDVVPAYDPDAWPCDPYSGEVIDGRVYGRGACDHKSPIVAMLGAVEALLEEDVDLAGELLFVFDSNEERGGEHGMKYVVENADLDPDMGIYAVTTSLDEEAAAYFDHAGIDNVFHANYGNQVFRVTVTGDVKHPLTPAETDSAGARSARLLPIIYDYTQEVKSRETPLVGNPDAEITTLESDGRPGRASQEARLHVHRYYGPEEDTDEVYEEFRDLVIDGATEAGFGDAVSVERIKHMPNTVVPTDHPLIEATRAAARRVRSREPTVTGIPAQTGITWLVRELEMPMIMFGFGHVNLHHADPEWIAIDDVVDTTKAYALTYQQLLRPST